MITPVFDNLELELGDIIEIIASTNPEIHEVSYFECEGLIGKVSCTNERFALIFLISHISFDW